MQNDEITFESKPTNYNLLFNEAYMKSSPKTSKDIIVIEQITKEKLIKNVKELQEEIKIRTCWKKPRIIGT